MSFEYRCESRKSVLRRTILALLIVVVSAGAVLAASPTYIYDSIPNPLPPNVPSEAFQASHVAEWGDEITFAGSNRNITQVTLVISDWSTAANYPTYPGASGPTWNYPITLNLYNVDNSGSNPPQPGTLIATRTATFAIPWRPASDPTCADPTRWRASDGNCYGGLAFKVTFDFTGTVVPNQLIYGVAINTSTFGAAPVGVVGPYDGLNFGFAQVPPSIGSNPFPDSAFLNAADGGGYNDGGSGGSGTFRRDPSTTPTPADSWAPFSGAIQFEVGVADLAVTKTGPAIVNAGANVTYNVTVTNLGASDAQTVTLTDVLPAGTTFVSEAQNSGPAFTCINPAAGGTGSVSCSIATLASGSTATFALVFNVNGNVATGTALMNTASVATVTSDSDPANNSASSTATVIGANQVPALSPPTLLLLALAVALIAAMKLRF
jgi:uncharacterized repeat protein (TIGR01451 family)